MGSMMAVNSGPSAAFCKTGTGTGSARGGLAGRQVLHVPDRLAGGSEQDAPGCVPQEQPLADGDQGGGADLER